MIKFEKIRKELESLERKQKILRKKILQTSHLARHSLWQEKRRNARSITALHILRHQLEGSNLNAASHFCSKSGKFTPLALVEQYERRLVPSPLETEFFSRRQHA